MKVLLVNSAGCRMPERPVRESRNASPMLCFLPTCKQGFHNVLWSTPQTQLWVPFNNLAKRVRQPITFFSQNLILTEQHYSTFVRKLLAAYAAIRRFFHYLEGTEFFVMIDQKLLMYTLCSLYSDSSAHAAHTARKVWHMP